MFRLKLENFRRIFRTTVKHSRICRKFHRLKWTLGVVNKSPAMGWCEGRLPIITHVSRACVRQCINVDECVNSSCCEKACATQRAWSLCLNFSAKLRVYLETALGSWIWAKHIWSKGLMYAYVPSENMCWPPRKDDNTRRNSCWVESFNLLGVPCLPWNVLKMNRFQLETWVKNLWVKVSEQMIWWLYSDQSARFEEAHLIQSFRWWTIVGIEINMWLFLAWLSCTGKQVSHWVGLTTWFAGSLMVVRSPPDSLSYSSMKDHCISSH